MDDLPAFQFETRSFGKSFVESDAVSAIQHVHVLGSAWMVMKCNRMVSDEY